ncbi:hypothetical protein EYF80_022293 [Liparis tanakae]|uniref:Uncharacterized protein n=1 Tax=Liparis tanakae TaxID=230148 RepID=A0A4Z2HNY8_9TELE|nr:hypothetical protein EYF80_022293 [Liparis tanakae]
MAPLWQRKVASPMGATIPRLVPGAGTPALCLAGDAGKEPVYSIRALEWKNTISHLLLTTYKLELDAIDDRSRSEDKRDEAGEDDHRVKGHKEGHSPPSASQVSVPPPPTSRPTVTVSFITLDLRLHKTQSGYLDPRGFRLPAVEQHPTSNRFCLIKGGPTPERERVFVGEFEGSAGSSLKLHEERLV